MTSPHRLVFAGCARDSAPHLPAVLRNIEALAKELSDAAFIFVENDSMDDTAAQLQSFCDSQALAQLIRLDGLGQSIPARTVRLAMARNTIVSVLKTWEQVAHFDTLVMLDMDDINTRPWPADVVLDAVSSLHRGDGVVAVFANQLGSHYDLWALREPQRCPGDIWEEAFEASLSRSLPDDQAVYEAVVAPRIFSLAPQDKPMPVDSAFGGLGLYNLAAVRTNPIPYCGETVKAWGSDGARKISRWQICEHVSFHRGLALQGGRLQIRPDLINADVSGKAPNPSAFRTLAF